MTALFAHSWTTGPHPLVPGATLTSHDPGCCKLCVAWRSFGGVRADADVTVGGRFVVPLATPDGYDA